MTLVEWFACARAGPSMVESQLQLEGLVHSLIATFFAAGVDNLSLCFFP
jgi:hypothetical protein